MEADSRLFVAGDIRRCGDGRVYALPTARVLRVWARYALYFMRRVGIKLGGADEAPRV